MKNTQIDQIFRNLLHF